jgi:hypothetical protein
MDLEFATNRELIMELINRSTFVGLVIFSDKEQLGKDTIHDHFSIASSVKAEDVVKIIEVTRDTMNKGE